jgi:HD-GYP domain-containing protein (c-di-GMP phosphodiesterase class II)
MYFPILLAAWLFTAPGAVIVALVGGLTLGPLMPLNTATGEMQMAAQWLSRTAFFAVFGALAGQASRMFSRRLMAVESKVDRLSEMYTRVLSSLALTVEVRDEPTKGHCERVAHNSLLLGTALGFNEQQQELLYWSALLHDLGKIAVPEYILLKPGPLTEEEYNQIKLHPGRGAELLESISPDFVPLAEVVRAHHERWDGAGYPLGLRGESIPLLSRIIAIVDVFEALTSARPYRQPVPPEQAMNYLNEGAGSQFDPRLVPLFEQLYRAGKLRLASVPAEPAAASALGSAQRVLDDRALIDRDRVLYPVKVN